MKDYKRGISAHFFHDLKEGTLCQIVEECKRNRALLFIRNGYVNVYHQGRSLLKIEEVMRSQNYHLSFDFNYARYLENWQENLQKLNQLGFALTGKGEKISDQKLVSSISFDSNVTGYESIFKILRGLIDDYLKPYKNTTPKYDYFKAHDGKEQPKRCQPGYLEKQRQQEIALANRHLGEGYCIYDMEYAQKRNSSAEENLGRYDLLALRYQAENPVALTFIELKSTKNACVGKNGIGKHEADLQKYLKTEMAKQRIGEAEQNIRQLSELGLLQGMAPNFLPETLPLESLFIFTDEARHYSRYANNSVEVCNEDNWKIG